MVPSFKYYFFPFLYHLYNRGKCRLFVIGDFIASYYNLQPKDLQELTKGGTTTKHSSRLNYCAAYLKKMKLITSLSSGSYAITPRGEAILNEFGENLTLNDLRNLPEFLATQINVNNEDYVYIKEHIRCGRKVCAYVSHKKNFNPQNPNVESEISETYRNKLRDDR